MISVLDRSKAITLIQEADTNGAREDRACEELGLANGRYNDGEVT
jgi:hypothetical protein